MGMTIIEKIFARKAGLGSVSPGETVVVDVDMTVLIDLQFATMWIQPNRIHDADKLAVIMDHAVPAPTIKDATGGGHARKFVADFGIERFYDVGRHGICHQVIAENGLARPGEILACTDSHTCAAGAYNTAARGLGPAEVYSIMCTGTTWFQVAPTIRYELDGAKPNAVSGKDIFLHIANEYGDAANLNLEFGGPGLAGIPMHDRRTIATQGAEVSADFSTFEPDGVLTSFLDERGVTGYATAAPDFDANYQDVRHVDLANLEPYVARPGTVSRKGYPCHSSTTRRSTRRSSDPARTVNSRTSRSPRKCCAARPWLRGCGCWSHPPRRRCTGRPCGWATCRTSRTRVRSSPTPPAAPVSGTTWACWGPARCASRPAPATSPAGWAAPRRRFSWRRLRPSRRPRSPDTSPIQGA